MGFKQTDTARTARHRYHQIGLVRGQFGNVPEDEVGQVHRRHRLRRLGGSALGTRPAQVRHRRRRGRLRQGARRPGQEARPGDLHRRHAPARPGARRRAERQDAASSAAARARRKPRTRPGATTGNNPPRTDPYFVPDDVGKLIHDEVAEGPARLRPPAPGTWASCRTARSRCPASSARRPTAGATGSCSRRCPARSTATRSPTSATCQPGTARRALRPGLGRVQEVRRHLRPRMPPERTGDGRHRVGQRLHQPHVQGRLRRRRRLQPRRLAPGMAERLGRAVHPRVPASSSTAPTSRACGWPASTAAPAGSAAIGRWATGPTAGTSSPPAPPATPTRWKRSSSS